MTTDHLGNEYPSLSAMCRAWNIPLRTYSARMKAEGWTKEKALTTPVGKRHRTGKSVTDHKGNTYPSIKAMCEAYNIPRATFDARMKAGWDLESALTTSVGEGRSKPITDYKGITYPSITAMCEAYGISGAAYSSRMAQGWTQEAALTTPVGKDGRRGKPIADHEGNEYTSTVEMCRAYGISSLVFNNRRRCGWSLEKALTTPVEERKPVTDHKGNTYPSIVEMCRAYGIPVNVFNGRVRNYGWTLEEALTTPVGEKKDRELQDVIRSSGLSYEEVLEMIHAASRSGKKVQKTNDRH